MNIREQDIFDRMINADDVKIERGHYAATASVDAGIFKQKMLSKMTRYIIHSKNQKFIYSFYQGRPNSVPKGHSGEVHDIEYIDARGYSLFHNVSECANYVSPAQRELMNGIIDMQSAAEIAAAMQKRKYRPRTR